jgi:DNA (cytosine-5)-methyltransferase 1
MTAKGKKLRAADLFCGGGGTTTGAQASGFVDVVLAVNHWRTAIQTHRQNHPHVRHICARIDDIDPRHDTTIPEIDLLMASPECTHHSIARGGRPIDDQKRATPWHVCVWAEAKRPAWLMIENVREFRDWGPLDADCRPIKSRKGEIYRQWIKSLEAIGYQIDAQVLNAADFGAATKRHRLFIVGRLKHSRKDIPWPEPTHAGRWKPAYEIINWSKPCPSIFSRKRCLAEKTLRRIEAGLRKFVGPYVVELRNNQAAADPGQPVSTICTSGAHHGLAIPFISQFHNGPDGERRNYSPEDPIPTLDTQNRYGLTMPFFLPRQGYYDCQKDKPSASINEPLNVITANHGPGNVVMPYLFDVNHGEDAKTGNRSFSVEAPLGVVTTKQGVGLAMPFTVMLSQSGSNGDRVNSVHEPMGTITTAKGGERAICIPWLTKYYGTGTVQGVDQPVDTITTRDRFGVVHALFSAEQFQRHFERLANMAGDTSPAMRSLLATMAELGVFDIGFRMLDVDELAAAQGFPPGYMLFGTKAEQVKQVGNAVCPPVAEAICRAIGQAA